MQLGNFTHGRRMQFGRILRRSSAWTQICTLLNHGKWTQLKCERHSDQWRRTKSSLLQNIKNVIGAQVAVSGNGSAQSAANIEHLHAP
ncbi:MAG: hypothetical protein LBI39_02710 [Puniceicoccales bacterium]|nr:hypothetical protein [Puniceicoccales bacterium]